MAPAPKSPLYWAQQAGKGGWREGQHQCTKDLDLYYPDGGLLSAAKELAGLVVVPMAGLCGAVAGFTRTFIEETKKANSAKEQSNTTPELGYLMAP